jgi:hypothetical protein
LQQLSSNIGNAVETIHIIEKHQVCYDCFKWIFFVVLANELFHMKEVKNCYIQWNVHVFWSVFSNQYQYKLSFTSIKPVEWQEIFTVVCFYCFTGESVIHWCTLTLCRP